MIDYNNRTDSLYAIVKHFNMVGNATLIKRFGSGHINDTYQVTTDQEDKEQYMLQKINHHVFKDVDALMHNILLVCNHVKRKLSEQGAEELYKRSLTPVLTKSNEAYCKDDSGHYWRMFILIKDTISYDIVATTQQAYQGGKAFGNFQYLLSDLSPLDIHSTIPDFLHIGKRLEHFKRAIRLDFAYRSKIAAEEIAFLLNRKERMNAILEMASRELIPLRITHNDTKFNNVLLDKNDQYQCVIDIDTVMPGYIAYDFGDAIRTIINTAAEDEQDLSKIKLNIPLFQAFTEGYLEEVNHFIRPAEVDSLIEGVLLLPYMQAVRFLTDYLEGDVYYKTNHNQHNLQRTKAQIKLVNEIEKAEPELRLMISEKASVYKSKL